MSIMHFVSCFNIARKNRGVSALVLPAWKFCVIEQKEQRVFDVSCAIRGAFGEWEGARNTAPHSAFCVISIVVSANSTLHSAQHMQSGTHRKRLETCVTMIEVILQI